MKTGKVWRGGALTPGNVEEMVLLLAEIGGTIEVLLVIYVLHVQIWSSSHPITIRIENTEVLDRAHRPAVGDNTKYHLVLDYHLW